MANRRLSKKVRTIHHYVNGIYGHRRIKAELAAMGHACGRCSTDVRSRSAHSLAQAQAAGF
ncbi:IS3 family transposase [Stutzerimonas balearica]|uniref:IS3 family transposase n=1 Tax=Stutzerimonas balearica TaxID=74829 RepID=UPI003F5C6467